MLADPSTFAGAGDQPPDRRAPHRAGAAPGHRLRLVHRPHDDAGQAPARGTAGLPVLPARAAVGAGLDAAGRAERGPAQPVAAHARAGRGDLRQRLLVRWPHRAGRGALGAGAVPVRLPGVPGDGRHARGSRAHGRGERLAHDLAHRPAAAAAGAAGLRHPVVRGGDGVVRDPAAAGHAREDLRVHDADLRSRLRRPCRALRPGHGAGGAAAGAHREPHRGAVENPQGPRLHHDLRPRLSGAPARPRRLALGAVRGHRDVLRRLRRAALRGLAAELVHGAERLSRLGDAHDPALDRRAVAHGGADVDQGHARRVG